MDHKQIAIIGAGITGLLTALSLKQKEPHAEIAIYESGYGYDTTRHQIIWKSGIKQLLALGLGKRLSKICSNSVNINCIDSTTNESFQTLPEAESVEVDDLPAMISVREIDMIRMLLTALGGREDLVKGEFIISSANNQQAGAENPVHGIEADLCVGNWFEDEGHPQHVPFIYWGHELTSLRLSSEHGTVSFVCTNGFGTKCTILIGIYN